MEKIPSDVACESAWNYERKAYSRDISYTNSKRVQTELEKKLVRIIKNRKIEICASIISS